MKDSTKKIYAFCNQAVNSPSTNPPNYTDREAVFKWFDKTIGDILDLRPAAETKAARAMIDKTVGVLLDCRDTYCDRGI